MLSHQLIDASDRCRLVGVVTTVDRRTPIGETIIQPSIDRDRRSTADVAPFKMYTEEYVLLASTILLLLLLLER